MKKILFFHLFLLSFISCSKDEFLFIRELSSDEQIRVSEFERNYINHLIINSKSKSDSKDEIFLIGYKTISYHDTDSIFVNGYFLGSDCSIAMAQGHCWNEVMD